MKSFSIAAALALFAALPAAAQTIWNFGDTTNPGSCTQAGYANANNFGNTWGCSQQPDGITRNLEVKSYAATSSGNFMSAFTSYEGTGSGVGVRNSQAEGLSATNPQHAMDNSGQLDVLVLKFTEGPVALNRIQLGWWSNDSDLTILRWTGVGAPDAGATNITNNSIGSLIGSGWSLVTSISNAGTTMRSFNAGGLESSYWLVSAFNSTLNGGVGIGDTAADYVKVLAVGATVPTRVAEPGSLALVAAAGFGAFIVRRRRRNA